MKENRYCPQCQKFVRPIGDPWEAMCPNCLTDTVPDKDYLEEVSE